MSNEFHIPEYDILVTHVLRGCSIIIACSIIYGHREHAFQSSEHLSTESAVRHLRTRGRLIIAGALLLLVDQINNIVYTSLLITGVDYGPPLFIANRVVYMCSMVVSGPILFMTNLLRCAVIILDDPKFRTRFLHMAVFMCLLLLTSIQVGAGWAIYTLATANPPTTRWNWIIFHYVPVWATVPMGMYPLMIIIGSIWSLASVARQGSQPSSMVAASHDSVRPAQVAPIIISSAEKHASASNPSLSRIKSMGSNGHLSGSQLAQSNMKSGQDRAPKSSKKILYPLSATFFTLTLLLTLEWVAVLVLGINSSILGLKTNATISFLGLAALLTEASFGKLMRVASSKRRGRMKDDLAAVGTVQTAVLGSQLAPIAHAQYQQQGSSTSAEAASDFEIMSIVQDHVPPPGGRGMRRSSTAEMWGPFRDQRRLSSIHSQVRRESKLDEEPPSCASPPQS